MNTNSRANIAPAASPGQSVPSRRKSGMSRTHAQISKSAVAIVERSPACMTREMSGAAHLIVTCWKPHITQSTAMSANARTSRGLRSTVIVAFCGT
jgi:hypothetical protein